MNEYERVQGDIQRLILRYLGAIHAELIHSHDDVFLANQILSNPSILIKAPDQSLPIRFLHPEDKPNVSYKKAQEDMLKTGFVRVVDKEAT